MISSSQLERLNWEDAFVAQDKQHVVVGAIMCPPPPSLLAASQGGEAPEVPAALHHDISRRMYDRQLKRQHIEDGLARVEEMSESEEKDEPKTKRAKAWLLSSLAAAC